MTIDARLVKIYNEYLENGKEEEFIDMLYALLDMATVSVVEKVKNHRRYEKTKLTREEKKKAQARLEAYLNSLSFEKRIEFLNTPWEDLPDDIKDKFPTLVKKPCQFNFLRIAGEVEPDERQNEVFGARLTRYMEKHGMITSSENGTELNFRTMSEICNELLEKYDLKPYRGRKAQKTRVTEDNLRTYANSNIVPKTDKLTAIKVATGEPMWWLGGYRDNGVPGTGDPENVTPLYPEGPFSGKFRKKKTAEAS